MQKARNFLKLSLRGFFVIPAKAGICCIVIFMLSSVCFAALTMSLDTSSVDFGAMSPSDFKELPASGYHNNLAVISDTLSAWQVKIKVSSALTNASFPTVSIPNDNFRWMSTYAGNKNAPYQNLSTGLYHLPQNGYVNFSLVDELVYTSGQVAAFNDNNSAPNGTEIQFKYAIAMPSSQTAGTYNTTIVYTVTQ